MPAHRLALAVLLAAAGTASPGRAAPPGAARRLAVAAAANVKPAVDDLARAFEGAHPGTAVAVTAGASGAFYAQLRSGAPFDVFFSADRDYPRRLVEAGLVSGGEVVYAIGRLAVWTPPGSPLDLARRGLAALADPAARRIALANPALAPYGRAAEAALRSSGVYEAVKDRLVLGESAAQAAQFARAGAADAALLPLSLARAPALADGRVWIVPAAAHPLIAQSAVALAAAHEPGLAAEFLAFATGPAGRAVLARHGYDLP